MLDLFWVFLRCIGFSIDLLFFCCSRICIGFFKLYVMFIIIIDKC